MTLILNDAEQVLTGSLTLSGDLIGSSDIKGRRDGDSISFVTESRYGRIVWTGKLDGRTIEGTYMTEDTPEYVAVTGLEGGQRGQWKMTRR